MWKRRQERFKSQREWRTVKKPCLPEYRDGAHVKAKVCANAQGLRRFLVRKDASAEGRMWARTPVPTRNLFLVL